MRQEIIIKTYKYFNEFDKETQDLIVRKYNRINEDSWEFVSEDLIKNFTSELESLGYTDIKIEYSGFYSQGDGASFTAKYGNDEIYRINHRYSHSKSVTCDNEDLLNQARELMNKFYFVLRSSYDDLYSKDAIIETILANEYEFDIETLKIA